MDASLLRQLLEELGKEIVAFYTDNDAGFDVKNTNNCLLAHAKFGTSRTCQIGHPPRPVGMTVYLMKWAPELFTYVGWATTLNDLWAD